ncbi:MAG TPA: ABC transporter substrate-binding protein [Actinopolymorphaceae bacterium]|jgi:alpha-glucoside transport system substrate-binding protein
MERHAGALTDELVPRMTRISRRRLLRTAATISLAGLPMTTACSPGEWFTRPDRTVRVAVPWSAAELAAFRRVVRALFAPGESPPYDVQLVPLGDDIGTAISARGAGRVDVVMLPQPGLVREYRDALEPIPHDITRQHWQKYAPIWDSQLLQCGPQSEPRPYGLPFKFAHESLVWYRRSAFDAAGVEPPSTVDEWLAVDEALTKAGISPLAIAGADGWMLTLFFENLLLGLSPVLYDELSQPSSGLWTTAHVREVFVRLGTLWGAEGAIAGGVARSLATQFPDAVLEVFRFERAAMVVVPDYAGPFVNRFGNPHDVGIFRFPRWSRLGPEHPTVAGGDAAVLTAPAGENAKDFVRRLARRDAAQVWSSLGGFIPADRTVLERHTAETATQANPISRRIAELAPSLFGPTCHFDLSDRIGAAGGREGLWRVLQDFLAAVGDGRADRAEKAADEAVTRMAEFEASVSREGEPDGISADQTCGGGGNAG